MRILTEEQKRKQQKMPVLEMTRSFVEQNRGYYCVPGHRFERGLNPALLEQYGEGLFRYDLTETDNLDDLHHAEGPILEAQELAAELFGSEHCYFLVNGTTCGNEAMILTAVKPGEKILIARNAHKSVTMGLILSGAIPVWIEPEQLNDWGMAGAVAPEKVESILAEQPDIRAVFLVSPTYYGICSDLVSIARICHQRGVPLLVDEAHGPHFCFHPDFPLGAVESGADACAQSTHKTLGSITQTSMLHLQGNLLSRERLEENLKLVMSTSPSYVFMAAMDGARQQMAMEGETLLSDALHLAEMLKTAIGRMPGYRLLQSEHMDPLRIVLSADPMAIGGEKLQELLYEKGRISLEMSDPVSVVIILTWGNTEEEILHLIRILEEIHDETQNVGSGAGTKKSLTDAEEAMQTHPSPVVSISPRDAYYAEKESVPLEDALGRIAGELIAPYPPGIPVLCPGEEITEAVINCLKECRERKCVLHGPADESLTTIRVLIQETVQT